MLASLALVVMLWPAGACFDDDDDGYSANFWLCFVIAFALTAVGRGSASALETAVPPVARHDRELYLSSSAHASGYVDTDWRSDVELHNAGTSNAAVGLELLRHGMDNSSPGRIELTLRPGWTLRLDDVLMTSFGLEGKAALRVTTQSGAVLATNRTYNLLGDGNGLGLPAGASFGQYIPARGSADAIAHGERGLLIQLQSDAAFRTNLGLVNLTSASAAVEVDLRRADGSSLGTVPVSLAPFEYRQLTRVFEGVTSEPVADGWAVVRVTTEGGRVLAEASVVDNLTGDPVLVPAACAPPAAAGAEPLWIVAAAHAGGAAGTNWRTDLEVVNPNPTTVAYTVELLPHMVDNSTPRSTTLTIAPGRTVRHADVLQGLFGFDGTAALRIVPVGGPLIVTSRTYNLLGTGNPLGLPAGATFGQYIPAVSESDAVQAGEESRLIHLSHDASGLAGFRTNLIVVNATPSAASLVVDLHRPDGARIASLDVDLAPREYRQLNKVFELAGAGSVEHGYAVVRTTTAGGRFFALASVVDNLSGDPVGVGGVVVRSAGADGLLGPTAALLDRLGGSGLAEPVTLPEVVSVIAEEGVEGLLGALEDRLPSGVMTRHGGGATLDFGSGTTVDGQLLAGKVDLAFSDVMLDGQSVRGTVTETHRDYTVDGIAPDLTWLSASLDIQRRGDGSVHGSVTLAGSAGASGAATDLAGATTLSGLVDIDSAICLYYPIGGSVTLALPDGETVTVQFGPDCDGSFEREVEPGWDRVYSYQDPSTPGAQEHIVLASNAEILDDSYARFWIPSVGGTQFASRQQPGDTPPAVIRYRFSFDRPLAAGHLLTCMPAYHFSYSRAQNYLLGSADGSGWTTLLEVVNPTEGTGMGGCFNADLPASVLGAKELWLQVELYCWGPYAPDGAPLTHTAQHSRFGLQEGGTTFRLKVRFAEE